MHEYYAPDLALARSRAIREARRLVQSDALFLDTETTGLDERAEVVEVSIVDIRGSVVFDSLIRPFCPIPPDATAVHGITDTDVAQAPTFADVLLRLSFLLCRRPLCIYNADYDMRVMRQSAKAHGLDFDAAVTPAGPTCAMLMYAEFWGDWNDYRSSFRWQKLGIAASQQGIDIPPDLHRARADAELTRLLVLKMAQAETEYAT
jgi:DNA polymerase-3 subunit epsilon